VVRHLANARTAREDGGIEIPSSEYPIRVARQIGDGALANMWDSHRVSRLTCPVNPTRSVRLADFGVG
jgi:hypothetical protein